MTQIFSQVLKYFHKKEKNRERSLKKKTKKNPPHPPVKSRHQHWVVCGLFCLFFWLPSRHGLLHWSGCRPTSTVCWPSPDPNNSHLSRCQNKRQPPATCTDCWHFCVCCGPQGWKGSTFSLHSSGVYRSLELDFFIQGSLQCTATWRAILNALYLEKCEVVQRELAVKWTEAEKCVCVWCGSCMCAVMAHTCTFSFLCLFSSCGCACECFLVYRVYGVCACGFIPKGPIFDVSRIAHDRTSSSGSQSKAFRSHNHFHWIYKVQLKLGGIQVHEWCKRGSYRSCLNWSENYRSQVRKVCSPASCRHQKAWGSRGWGSWGWQAHRSIALFPSVLQAAVVVFPHSTI